MEASDDGSKPSRISMKPISTKTCKIICKVVQNLLCDALIINLHPFLPVYQRLVHQNPASLVHKVVFEALKVKD